MVSKGEENKSTKHRSQVGVVSSIGGEKTLSVMVETLVKHPRYGKLVRRRTKVGVHDPSGQAAMGDMVEVVPCRRISKNKSWRLVRVIRQNRSEK